ncbi:hypothetical protein GDO81_016141 [Engystomops pustulosus]|uniref:Dr1-associated corepressor n=1 Tax=Engystomops pustulosus TaxID=76066 RepID=A0AAV7AW95_ENGPU|nr:hypothetical protein GDO81_016141 [Engystomops pustulosus]
MINRLMVHATVMCFCFFHLETLILFYFLRKQCIELEQQFDFLKDLVATVPDMQGENEDNHTEGERVSRRGRKPGSSRKNGGTAMKGKDKKQSETDSEQEEDTEGTETEGEEESCPAPAANTQSQASFQSTPPAPSFLHFHSVPVMPSAPSALPTMPAPSLPAGCDEEEDYDS